MTIVRNAAAAAIAAAALAATAAVAQQPAPAAPASAGPAPATPVPAAPVPGTAAPAAGPPAGMEDCEACHALTKDAPPSIGPSLWGVGGRKAGAVADYAYSPAMKAYGVTWTPETLVPFLQHPTTTVAGTTMAYPGVPDPAAAQAIADYLMTLHD